MPVFNGKNSEVSFPTGTAYNAASSPIAYQDLDLSTWTGGGQAIVLVQINTTNATSHFVRENGKTAAAYLPSMSESRAVTTSMMYVPTDTNGVIEWHTGIDGGQSEVYVLAVIGAQP